MKETMAANRAREQAIAYDSAFQDFTYFAIDNFNSNITDAVKANWESFKFITSTKVLDVP